MDKIYRKDFSNFFNLIYGFSYQEGEQFKVKGKIDDALDLNLYYEHKFKIKGAIINFKSSYASQLANFDEDFTNKINYGFSFDKDD